MGWNWDSWALVLEQETHTVHIYPHCLYNLYRHPPSDQQLLRKTVITTRWRKLIGKTEYCLCFGIHYSVQLNLIQISSIQFIFV